MAHDIFSNLGQSAGTLSLILTLLWLVSLKIRDASIIDIFWGAGFGGVALLCWQLSDKTGYQTLLMALPTLWAVRLSLYLAKRNLGHGEDLRYRAMRERSGLDETVWRKRALFTVFFGQGVLIIIISAPIWVANATGGTTPIGSLAIIGAALWLVGFLFEAIGDAQLSRFMTRLKDYKGAYADKPILDTGLWRYTRHPNYFGNACMWWGIWLVALQAPFGWATLFAPLLMTVLLLRVSGKALLEHQLKKRPAYQEYMERTSGFIPWWPKKG